MRRIPLWTTLIPLVIGIGGYYVVWQRFSDQFVADLTRALPGQSVTVNGFPYRLEAGFDAPELQRGDTDFVASFAAARMILNRGPWQPELTVMRSIDAEFRLAISGVDGAQIVIAAPTAQGSLRRTGDRIARLSLAFKTATIGTGAMRAPLAAETIEVHLREYPKADAGAVGPRLPIRMEGAINATGVRLNGGSPLRLMSTFTINGKSPLRSYRAWADGGTLEFTHFRLTDATSEILDVSATIAPATSGTLRINGSLTTVCPATVWAAFNGGPKVSELRLRTPVRLAFGGNASSLSIDALVAGMTSLPRRRQLPPCPSLRG